MLALAGAQLQTVYVSCVSSELEDALMKIKWNELKPEDFEKLCYHILELNGFLNLQWHGKSGNDKGRDILATKIETPLPSVQKQSSWVIQCKRYTSKPPGKSELASFLNSAREFKPDNTLIIISYTLTSNTKDWLESIKTEYTFNIFLWEEQELMIQYVHHKDKLSGYFPSYNFGKHIVFFGANPIEFRVRCNEFSDVDICCSNCSNYEQARAMAKEFINFIRDNNVEFE